MAFYHKYLYPILHKKQHALDLNTSHNSELPLCLQPHEIIVHICQYLSIKNINRLYASCRDMRDKLEFVKEKVWVKGDYLWTMDLFVPQWKFYCKNEDGYYLNHQQVAYYHKKKSKYYDNIVSSDKSPILDIKIFGQYIYVQYEKSKYDENRLLVIYKYSNRRFKIIKNYLFETKSLIEILHSCQKYIYVNKGTLYIKQNDKIINKLKNSHDIISFNLFGDDLFYADNNGDICVIHNISRVSDRLYFKQYVDSNKNCVYGKYLTIKSYVPNPEYCVLLFHTGTKDIRAFHLFNEILVTISSDIYFYYLNRPLTNKSKLENLDLMRNNFAYSYSPSKILVSQFINNDYVYMGKLEDEFINFAILSNNNIVVCHKNGWIKIYDHVTFKCTKNLGKRIYQNKCQVIVSDNDDIYILETDDNGVNILTKLRI